MYTQQIQQILSVALKCGWTQNGRKTLGKLMSVTPPSPHVLSHTRTGTFTRPFSTRPRRPDIRSDMHVVATSAEQIRHKSTQSYISEAPLPCRSTGGTVRKHLASVVTWHLDHGPPDRNPSTTGSAMVDHVCRFSLSAVTLLSGRSVLDERLFPGLKTTQDEAPFCFSDLSKIAQIPGTAKI